jgi:hypothetical protein
LFHFFCASDNPAAERHQRREPTYQKVLDGRKRPIRGLWRRNDRFYARIAVEDAASGTKTIRRVPLDAQTVAQAELRRLLTRREDRTLPVLKRTPKFAAYVKDYLAFYKTVKNAKRPRTLETEAVISLSGLNTWATPAWITSLD